MTQPVRPPPCIETGVENLDVILGGGLPRGRLFLIQGYPGTGKTTLGLQFLREGVRRGERVLYATLLQNKSELEDVFRSHGWAFKGIDLLEFPEEIQEESMVGQPLFDTTGLRLNETTDRIDEALAQIKPQRVVVDSLAELAIILQNSADFQRDLVRLKHRFLRAGCTTLFTAGDLEQENFRMIQTLVHGVIKLTYDPQVYGQPRRWLEITKMRGLPYKEGRHALRIRTGGLVIFPNLEAFSQHDKDGMNEGDKKEVIPSGSEQFDAMLGGGLQSGTTCLITGSPGGGKSLLATMFVRSAAERGHRSLIFCFDEREDIFLLRAERLDLNIRTFVDQGLINIQHIHSRSLSPLEFMNLVRRNIKDLEAKIVVVDSLFGYFSSLPDEKPDQNQQLRELLHYLTGTGVLTFLIVATHGVFGSNDSQVNASYLTDAVILVRLFENAGEVRRGLSVFKKRYGWHENTIREFKISQGGIQVGAVITGFEQVLSDTPTFEGSSDQLM